MQNELDAAKRKTECFNIHKQVDMGNMGMKSIVQKLNGDPKSKFEVDHKMNQEQFHRLLCKLAAPKDSEEQQPSEAEQYEHFCGVFRKALCDAAEPFKGDLENVTYKAILQGFREFDPNAALDWQNLGSNNLIPLSNLTNIQN